MSDLESKTKTAVNIALEWDAALINDESQWVPLEEAQKLEIELNFYKEANRELIDFKLKILTEVHTPLAKIAEANKILDAFEESIKGIPQPQDMNTRIPSIIYGNLREVLKGE